MASKLFVGGLAYSVDDKQLNDFFAEVGTVASAQVIIDRDSKQSKGFGFVEMASDADMLKAIKDLNGKELAGRAVIVNEARPREEQPRFGGGGGGGRPQSRFDGVNNRSTRY